MEDTQSVATLLESTTSKIQQLQKAFAELESHRAITLSLKWKQIEEHFHGLEKSLKRRFTELEDQEKEFEIKTIHSKQVLERRQAVVMAKEEASLEKLQEKRDAAIATVLGAPVLKEKPSDAMENADVKLLSYPQLPKLCEEMDVGKLHKFISDNRKNLASIKEELPFALKAAADPGVLVLDSLNGFYTSEVSNFDGKKDSNLLGLRRTCIMLMECFSVFLANLDSKNVLKVISKDVKERAKVIAEEWKPKLDDLDVDASNGNSLEAHAFLQIVATFGIDSGFVQEDLSKLIPMVCRRRQTADLCRFLGLTEKIPGVINVLVNNGRHIDAVNLAFAFELTEQFSPVSLLKSYLMEARRAPSPVKSGNLSPNTQSDVSERELSALKAIIKCIEDHKLENEYPLGPLQKQILQLEKAKADKKQRATEVSKPQPKRPRANGHGPRHAEKNLYARTTDRYAPPSQYMYDHRPYATAAYNIAPYFGNGYHYQATYLH